MGGCLSIRSSSPASFDAIRLIHFNGEVHDFEDPLTVGDITGKPPKYLVCTPNQLISFSSSEALTPETQLQRGNIYYLLPLAALQWEASPADFIGIATRLTKVAKRSASVKNGKSPQSSPAREVFQRRSKSATERVLNPFSEQGRSKSVTERVLNPISEGVITKVKLQEPVLLVEKDSNNMKSCRAQAWRPILETIKEKSFGRRTDSDLPSPYTPTPR